MNKKIMVQHIQHFIILIGNKSVNEVSSSKTFKINDSIFEYMQVCPYQKLCYIRSGAVLVILTNVFESGRCKLR